MGIVSVAMKKLAADDVEGARACGELAAKYYDEASVDDTWKAVGKEKLALLNKRISEADRRRAVSTRRACRFFYAHLFTVTMRAEL